jgi:hypothetical protein
MSYKLTPTAADNFDELKRFVNDQLLKIANELNKPSTSVTVTTGTWTPVFSVPSGTLGYSHQSGNWTKLGDILFLSGKIQVSSYSLSGSTATLQITGLPQSIKSGHQGIFSFHYEGFNSLYAGLTGYADGSVIHVREQNATGTENVRLTSNSLVKFTGFYRV